MGCTEAAIHFQAPGRPRAWASALVRDRGVVPGSLLLFFSCANSSSWRFGVSPSPCCRYVLFSPAFHLARNRILKFSATGKHNPCFSVYIWRNHIGGLSSVHQGGGGGGIVSVRRVIVRTRSTAQKSVSAVLAVLLRLRWVVCANFVVRWSPATQHFLLLFCFRQHDHLRVGVLGKASRPARIRHHGSRNRISVRAVRLTQGESPQRRETSTTTMIGILAAVEYQSAFAPVAGI